MSILSFNTGQLAQVNTARICMHDKSFKTKKFTTNRLIPKRPWSGYECFLTAQISILHETTVDSLLTYKTSNIRRASDRAIVTRAGN